MTVQTVGHPNPSQVLQPNRTPVLADGMTADWRDEFNALPGSSAMYGFRWQPVQTQGSVLVALDGNAGGAGYLKITLDPRDPAAQADLIGTLAASAHAPFRQGWGVTLSRRSAYQHVWFGQIGCDANGTPTQDATPPQPVAFTAGVSVTSNVATIVTSTNHGFAVGQRILVAGTSDPRPTGLFTITAVNSPTSFSYAWTASNATYGTTGTVTVVDPSLGYQDCLGVIASDATSGNAVATARAEGLPAWLTAWNPANTWDASIVPNNIVNYAQAYTYAHQARFTVETSHERDWVGWTIHAVDNVAGLTSATYRDQSIPLSGLPGGFLPRLQARNLPTLSVPVGRITAASKTASTTATLTIPSHGLTTNDWIVVDGIRDQVNFANQTSSVQVASVVNANQITVVFGASATASSYGGTVFRSTHNTAPAGIASSAIQSITTSATGRLQLTFLASQGSFNVGESVCVVGLVDSGGNPLPASEGLYRVASSNTGTFVVELDPLQGQALPSLTTAGGTMLAATDIRVHFVRTSAHSRLAVEVESSRGHSRQVSSVPVVVNQINNTPGFNASQVGGATWDTVTGVQGTARLAGVAFGVASTTNDRASAALTGSGNSGTIADDFGQVISGVVNVSAVTGTTPTLDVFLQESFDGGTTWQDVYQLPRITATGQYQTPPLPITGRRRWNYVVGGTSPSFTTSITVTRANQAVTLLRQRLEYGLAPNTTGSAGTALYVDGCCLYGLIVTNGAGASVNPVYGIQLSVDGTNWVDSGIAVTVPPSSTAGAPLPAGNVWPARWARIYVKTGGTGATHTSAALTAVSS